MAFRYVIDASAGVELVLHTDQGTALEAKLDPLADWWVPDHYHVEVMNSLRKAERHDRRRDDVLTAFGDLVRDELLIAPLRPLLVAAWVRRGHLTVGDAFYVALAEAIGATLVTADLKLAKAPGLPVPVLTP